MWFVKLKIIICLDKTGEARMEEKQEKYSFGFVVLHYGGMDVTKQCISCVEKLYGTDIPIAIVDNHSPDQSGEKLRQFYHEKEQITILVNEENLGFARGNNVGYRFLRDQKHCNMICVMNNDVMVQQTDMLEKIARDYEQSGFGVLGPHVTLPEDKENLFDFNLKPVAFYISQYKQLSKMYQYYSSKLYPERELANRMIRVVQGLLRTSDKADIAEDRKIDYSIYHERHEDVLLHGCCLVFSPLYIEQFEECFCPDTFMFKEEELLYLRCKEHGLKTVYNPEINILHMEDVSTNSVYKKQREKQIFICKNQAESLQVLIRAMRPPLLSICIPCFNVEKLIGRCLDSILNQDFYDCEILCVDDGSTDGTVDILRAYEKIDTRVRVLVNEKNSKLVYTRKRAIMEARGRYIFQIDSDDCIPKNALHTIKQRLKAWDYPDVMEFRANIVLEASETVKATVINKLKKIKDDVLQDNYCRIHIGTLQGEDILDTLIADALGQMPWNKVVRTPLLQKAYAACDREDIYYKDDVYVCCILYAMCKRYVGIPDRLYKYSISTGKSRKMFTEEDFQEMCKTGQIADSLGCFFTGRKDEAQGKILIRTKMDRWLDLLLETIKLQGLDLEKGKGYIQDAYAFSELQKADAVFAKELKSKVEEKLNEFS